VAGNNLVVRFRVYQPDGASLGILPHPLSWEAGLPLNDNSSLTMTYPDVSGIADLLKNPCEVALEIANPRTGTFAEYPGCRFINVKRSVDLAQRPRTLSFTMPSYGWMLKKARFMSKNISRWNKKDKVIRFPEVSPGVVLTELLNETKGRDNLNGLTWDFTTTQDSNNAAWANKIEGDFDLGQDAWAITDQFSRQGLIDWIFDKRQLRVFNPNTYLRRDLDNDNGVIVHSLLAMTEEPVERSLEDAAGRLLMVGDEKISVSLSAPATAELPWGKWDEAIEAQGVTNTSTLSMLATHLLSARYKSRAQFAKNFAWTEGAPVPLVDYRQGDMIRGRDDLGSQKSAMRIYQITLSGSAPYGVNIALTLNDRFLDRDLQAQRWINRISGGGGPVGGGGTGGNGRPQPAPPNNFEKPKVPTNLAVTQAPYFAADGRPVSRADVAFDVVTQDIEGEEITVDRYNVMAVRSDWTFVQGRSVQVNQPNSPSQQRLHAFVNDLDSGYLYNFYVQAIRDSGRGSDWSDPISATMSYPQEGLPVPSAPIVTSKLSTLQVTWDGTDNEGEEYPAQFQEVQIEVSKDQNTWYHVGDIFTPQSSVIVSGQNGALTWSVGETVYVRFWVRNSAAITTGPSAVTSVAVQGVKGPDLEANTITANNVVSGTLTSEQIKAHSLSVDSLSVGNAGNMLVDPMFTSSDLRAHRLQAATASTTNATWSYNASMRPVCTFSGAAQITSVFPLLNTTLMPILNYAVRPTMILPSPERAWPIYRRPQYTGDPLNGGYKARLQVTVSGYPTTPSGSLIMAVQAYQYLRDGSAQGGSPPFLIPVTTLTGNGTFTYETAGQGLLPNVLNVAAMQPVVVLSGSASFSGVTVTLNQIEIWQETSINIGDGQIRTPLLAADAVTADKIDVNALQARHRIDSSYYMMKSADGVSSVEITNNANYVNQAGMRFIPNPSQNISAPPKIFLTDPAGSGGWDPNGFVMAGPERLVNDTGRVDIQLAYGITGSFMKRNWGANTQNAQGIIWRTSDARLQICGLMETTNRSNDMFRGINYAAASGSWNMWTVTWGSPNWLYYPICQPTVLSGTSTTNTDAATCLVLKRDETSFSVKSSLATTRMEIFCFAGGSNI
jgi:hypothetical protein